jgi:hypothetical protein
MEAKQGYSNKSGARRHCRNVHAACTPISGNACHQHRQHWIKHNGGRAADYTDLVHFRELGAKARHGPPAANG